MRRPESEAEVSRWRVALGGGVLALLLGATPVLAQTIVVGPPLDISVVPGGVVEVPIEVDMTGAGGLDIASLQYEVSWDPALLTYLGATSEAPSGWSTTLNETGTAAGVLAVAQFSPTGTTGSFVSVRLQFEAASVAEPTNAFLDMVVGAAGDEMGADILPFIEARSVALCIGIMGILGDVNDDGAVNIIDAQQVARHSIGLATPNAPKMADAGDVNEDGAINIIDAQQIARYAVGLATPNAPNIGTPLPGCGEPPTTAVISGTITLSDAFLAPPPDKVAAARQRALTASARRGQKSVPGLGDLQALRLRPPFAGSGAEIPTDQIIVSFRAAALGAPAIGSAQMAWMSTAQALSATMRSRLSASDPVAAGEAEIIGVSPPILAARLRVLDLSRIDEVTAALRSDLAVQRVRRYVLSYSHDREDILVRASPAEPNDDLYELQAWHYDMIDLPEAWEITTGSASVLVAVVDDGTRFDHPDLAANLTSDGYDFVSSTTLDLCAGGTIDNAGDGDGYDSDPTTPAAYDWDVDQQCATLADLGSHGSHVAGTIGAVGSDGVGVTGVNWTVAVRPVRVLGVIGWAGDYDISQGILYAAGLPADDGSGGLVQAPSAARIINLSLGGPTSDPDLENAVIAASNAGALIIASAGNSASSEPHYPSAYPQTISVSAVGPDTLRASYSNFGSTIDIAAPGGDFEDGYSLFGWTLQGSSFGVLSTMWDFGSSAPALVFAHGTSMSAPHVSGVAALLLAHNPSLTAGQLRARLLDYALDMGTAGWDEVYGAGLLNARNSLTQSLAPPRDLYARLYNAATGGTDGTIAVEPDGSYEFTALADGDYHVFAGQDANGDQSIGLPGRRWGAYGGSATPSTITVAGPGVYSASFTVGFPIEVEPNDTDADADAMPVGGYLNGAIGASDADVTRMLVSQAGEYTFETSGASGYCAWAGNEDTILELYDSSFTLVTNNDDIDYGGYNWCSRITVTLQPGTYYLSVSGWYGMGLPYRVEMRSGG